MSAPSKNLPLTNLCPAINSRIADNGVVSILKETLHFQGVNSNHYSSEIELRKRDAEGLEGVDGGAVVQVEPIFADLQLVSHKTTIIVVW